MLNHKSKERNTTLFLLRNCDELRQDFLSLETPKDLAILLEVSYDRLIYHLYKVEDHQKYVEFSIPKKSGEHRVILAPSTAIKILQRKLSQILYSVYEPKVTVHGFSPGRSIVTNAQQHIRKRFVLNIDLQDFFGSIHFGRVRGIFIAPPYNCPKDVATILAKMCCHLGKLPQGAPTSPVISNMICAKIDSQLRILAKDFKCTYTRYADDITFSTTLPIFPREIAYINCQEDQIEVILGDKLISIIQNNGFQINKNKVRLQHKSHHQEVTGLTVNKFPNVKRSYVREISSMLHAWDKFGLESVEEKYINKGSKDQMKTYQFRDVLRGKIYFLGMVRGKDNTIYRKYLKWYYELLSSSK